MVGTVYGYDIGGFAFFGYNCRRVALSGNKRMGIWRGCRVNEGKKIGDLCMRDKILFKYKFFENNSKFPKNINTYIDTYIDTHMHTDTDCNVLECLGLVIVWLWGFVMLVRCLRNNQKH